MSERCDRPTVPTRVVDSRAIPPRLDARGRGTRRRRSAMMAFTPSVARSASSAPIARRPCVAMRARTMTSRGAVSRARARASDADASASASDDEDGVAPRAVTPDAVYGNVQEERVTPSEVEARARERVRFPLACPVSFRALNADGVDVTSGLKYVEDDGRWNLTVGSAVNAASRDAAPGSLYDLVRGALPSELKGLLPTSSYFGTATFETPQVAFAYERGWRDSFKRAGFPGPDEEAQLAMEALGDAAKDGIIVDASCGSGLFSRRFLKSGLYRGVVALDYSDAMLRQAKTYMDEEKLLGDANVVFVRADIARLPFPEASLDGVHAGAAIHCWPDSTTAIAEITRVLKPGATFCGTTFLNLQLPFLNEDQQQLFDSVSRDISRTANAERGFRWWSKRELQDLCADCGLVDFKCDVRNQFIFFSAKKPFTQDGA